MTRIVALWLQLVAPLVAPQCQRVTWGQLSELRWQQAQAWQWGPLVCQPCTATTWQEMQRLSWGQAEGVTWGQLQGATWGGQACSN